MFGFRRYDPDIAARELDAQLRIQEAEAAQRHQERQAFLTAIQAMVQVSVAASEASSAQAAAFKAFLDSYKITDAPKSRVLDEQQDYDLYLKQHGYNKDDIDEQLATLHDVLDRNFAD